MDKLDDMFNAMTPPEQQVAALLWQQRAGLVEWPATPPAGPLVEVQRVGVRFHTIPDEIRTKAKRQKVRVDTRSNGPAIMAFELAGGHRPQRADGKRGWPIHHIYDGTFPWPTHAETVRAVAEPAYFTDARGLVAAHPAFDGAVSELGWLAWKLRLEAFDRFGFDPDEVLAGYRRRHPAG